jgi:hypothetical protein
MIKTATVMDPSHELYGRVVVVVRESEWYTHVRALYQTHVQILTKNQYVINESEKQA